MSRKIRERFCKLTKSHILTKVKCALTDTRDCLFQKAPQVSEGWSWIDIQSIEVT